MSSRSLAAIIFRDSVIALKLNRIWASLAPGEPLIRKEHDKRPECHEALDGFRNVMGVLGTSEANTEKSVAPGRRLSATREAQQNVDTFHVQSQPCRDNLQRLGHCVELNRIWASLAPGEPLIRKEYEERPECLEALEGFRSVKIDNKSPISQ